VRGRERKREKKDGDKGDRVEKRVRGRETECDRE
jgi:hypothetical protein